MQITAAYRAQNQQLHASQPKYGTSGARWTTMVRKLCEDLGTMDVLDYGCGKGTLHDALDFYIHEYDPCIAGLDAAPQPADLVVCTDVLEHIEPECLDEVLDELQRCTKKAALMTVCIKPAKKLLPDGRNAHICLLPIREWLNRLQDRFYLTMFQDLGNEFLVIARPL